MRKLIKKRTHKKRLYGREISRPRWLNEKKKVGVPGQVSLSNDGGGNHTCDLKKKQEEYGLVEKIRRERALARLGRAKTV